MTPDAPRFSPIRSLETAALLLTSLGRYEVRRETGADSGPSLLVSRRDPLLDEVVVRVAFADDVSADDLERWAAGDAPSTSLLLLTGEEDPAADTAHSGEWWDSPGPMTRLLKWSDFFAAVVQLPAIEAHYQQLAGEYDEIEGDGFVYVKQSALIEGRTEPLLDWTLGDPEVGITYIVADYGEGKTSFCLNYVLRAIVRVREGRPVPLLFNLNEHSAGNLVAFVKDRLRADYQLELDFGQFRELCLRGVFVPVFDALDQMHNGEGGTLRIEDDHQHIMELSSTASPLYVTCRRNFFEQHLRELRKGEEFRIAYLRSFDQDQMRQALGGERGELAALLAEPENHETLANIHLKPLMLHVILRHSDEFQDLLARRRVEAAQTGEQRPITEFEVFELLYNKWLQLAPFNGLGRRPDAVRAIRELAIRAQLEGMNQPVSLSRYLRRTDLRQEHAAPLSTSAVREDLLRLPLLNRALLRRDDPLVAFRFNAYLEFITARAVLDELIAARDAKREGREAVRQKPLTWETRQMIAPNLSVDSHGVGVTQVIERSRNAYFADVKFSGGNVVTLVLDCLQHPRVPAGERQRWHEFLARLRLHNVVLQRLDARGANLTGISFAGADLTDSDFSFAVLQDANLSEAHLDNALFKEAGAVLKCVFVSQVEADPDGWRLAGGTENGIVVVWASATPHPVRTPPLHAEPVNALGAEPRSGHLYSVAPDGWLRETDPSNPQIPFGGQTLSDVGGLRAMVVSTDGNLVVGGDRRTLVILDRDARERHRLELPEERRAVVTALALDEDRDVLYAGDRDGDIWQFATWRHASVGVLYCADLGGEIPSLTVTADGSIVALVADVGAVAIPPGGVPEPLNVGRPAASVAYARDADAILWHDKISVWRRSADPTDLSMPLCQLPPDIGDAVLSCSADASLVAVGGNRIVVWQDGGRGLEERLNEPMRMDCSGLRLHGCEGLLSEQKQFLRERGGVFEVTTGGKRSGTSAS